MLIKEYRIPLPLTVEEYRIAQLYMIAKKSRNETHGEGSGVEILINEPYSEGPGGAGQYTKKIYHVGSHLPGWLKSLLPKSVLTVEEEAWNAYPYTRTRFTCPFVEKFSLDIETRYYNDGGHQDNVFQLNGSDLSARQTDLIDVVKDQDGSGCAECEDPRRFVSQKTGRGPLCEGWIDSYWSACQGKSTPLDNGMAIMCAYKLCKVDFRYWGVQSKVERFVHDFALRRTMLSAHTQAWAWQDEWFGLTLSDIRRIEAETQRELALRFNQQQQQLESSDPASTAQHHSVEESAISSTQDTPAVTGNQSWAMDIRERSERCEDDSDDEFFDCVESDVVPVKLASEGSSVRQSSVKQTDGSVDSLILLLHAGSMLEYRSDKAGINEDFVSFKSGVESVISKHYPNFSRRVHVRLVECPSLCNQSLELLSRLSAVSCNWEKTDGCSLSRPTVANPIDHAVVQSLALGAVPLLVDADPSYRNSLEETARSLNAAFSNFASPGIGTFSGHVHIVADSAASLLAYDILTSYNKNRPTSPDADKAESKLAQIHESGPIDAPNLKRSSSWDSSVTSDTKSPSDSAERVLHFHVADLFMLGSPLPLVLALRSLRSNSQASAPLRPRCRNLYNIFHSSNPLAFRLEPLLCPLFLYLPPVNVARYQRFPLGDGLPTHIFEYVHYNSVFSDFDERNGGLAALLNLGLKSDSSPGIVERPSLAVIESLLKCWWGDRRIDYSVYSPGVVSNFPSHALPTLFQSSYWESRDIISFIVRCVLNSKAVENSAFNEMTPPIPCERWMRKRTSAKVKKISSNHRGNDILILEGQPQVLSARFSYGPLDLVSLSGEKVDVYLKDHFNNEVWTLLDTVVTDKNGRLMYQLNDQQICSVGFHPVKMVVKGDHTVCSLNLCVVPARTECVVFSIDGSFTASMSVSGRDPKVRASAIHVARHWQELGYLLIYVTGRPDMQSRKVLSWLEQHNFPRGLVFFTDGFSTEPLRHKTEFLKKLVENTKVSIHAAYGSAKDISVYSSVGLPPSQIFIVGRSSRKPGATYLSDGYAVHLAFLTSVGGSRPARGNPALFIPRGCFEVSLDITSGARSYRQSMWNSHGSACSGTASLPARFSSTKI